VNLDRDIRPDIREVLETAAVLEISEFRVFELAYADWYGRTAPLANMERIFSTYMYHDLVPAWVRQFTRQVLRLRDENRLDPADFGVHHEPPTPTMIYLGIRYAVWAALTLALIVIGAMYIEGPAGCFFPPCY